MRLPSLKRLVWVDAICIDQASVQERNHQVHEMAKIYKGASIVPVYLGEADQMDNDLFDFLQGTCGLKLLHSTETYAKYLKRLVSRSWFDRTWVMQEFGLERRGFFICGSKAIALDQMSLENPQFIDLPVKEYDPPFLGIRTASSKWFGGRKF